MREKQYHLEAIIASDPFGLFEETFQKFSGRKDETQRLVASFAEIDEFHQEHNRIPTKSKKDIIEFALACRLEGILANDFKI